MRHLLRDTKTVRLYTRAVVFIVCLAGASMLLDHGPSAVNAVVSHLDSIDSAVNWEPARNISQHPGGDAGSNEPASAENPISQTLALAGGNYTFKYYPPGGSRHYFWSSAIVSHVPGAF